jgi:hypothetical protein
LLLTLIGLAAAGDDHVSLLQTAATAHSFDLGKKECRAARAKARESKAAMKEARAAMKAARAAFKAARATYKTDKGALADACPESEKPPKVKPGKPCTSKGFEESIGYIRVQSAYKKVELIPGSEAGRIGTYVYRGEWLQKTEGEKQEEYHKEMCKAIKPEFCGGEQCQDIRGAHTDPTCVKTKNIPYNNCAPRGREGVTSTADNNQYPAYMPAANYVFCMNPICQQLCAEDENCGSVRTTPAHRICEFFRASEPALMPHYGAHTGNYLVPQDGIFCVKK